ncbi:MAG: hypothetical protein WDL99_00005, partial [Candidatus Omnitrophota bacterium]
STFTDINQKGSLNKIDNNVFSTFNRITQTGIGNSISKNLASTFTDINQKGSLNKIDNNVFSTFNRITQTGIGNSISGNKSLTLANSKQYGVSNKMDALDKLTIEIENINQTGFVKTLDNNVDKDALSALGGGGNNTPSPMEPATEQKSLSKPIRGNEGDATEKETPMTTSSDKKTVPEGSSPQPATSPGAASTTPVPVLPPKEGPRAPGGDEAGKNPPKQAESSTNKKDGGSGGDGSSPAPATQAPTNPDINPPVSTPGVLSPTTISTEQIGLLVTQPAQGPPVDAQNTNNSSENPQPAGSVSLPVVASDVPSTYEANSAEALRTGAQLADATAASRGEVPVSDKGPQGEGQEFTYNGVTFKGNELDYPTTTLDAAVKEIQANGQQSGTVTVLGKELTYTAVVSMPSDGKTPSSSVPSQSKTNPDNNIGNNRTNLSGEVPASTTPTIQTPPQPGAGTEPQLNGVVPPANLPSIPESNKSGPAPLTPEELNAAQPAVKKDTSNTFRSPGYHPASPSEKSNMKEADKAWETAEGATGRYPGDDGREKRAAVMQVGESNQQPASSRPVQPAESAVPTQSASPSPSDLPSQSDSQLQWHSTELIPVNTPEGQKMSAADRMGANGEYVRYDRNLTTYEIDNDGKGYAQQINGTWYWFPDSSSSATKVYNDGQWQGVEAGQGPSRDAAISKAAGSLTMPKERAYLDPAYIPSSPTPELTWAISRVSYSDLQGHDQEVYTAHQYWDGPEGNTEIAFYSEKGTSYAIRNDNNGHAFITGENSNWHWADNGSAQPDLVYNIGNDGKGVWQPFDKGQYAAARIAEIDQQLQTLAPMANCPNCQSFQMSDGSMKSPQEIRETMIAPLLEERIALTEQGEKTQPGFVLSAVYQAYGTTKCPDGKCSDASQSGAVNKDNAPASLFNSLKEPLMNFINPSRGKPEVPKREGYFSVKDNLNKPAPQTSTVQAMYNAVMGGVQSYLEGKTNAYLAVANGAVTATGGYLLPDSQSVSSPVGIGPKMGVTPTANGLATSLESRPNIVVFGRGNIGVVEVGGNNYLWDKTKEGSAYKAGKGVIESAGAMLGLSENTMGSLRSFYDKATTVGSLAIGSAATERISGFGDWNIESGSQVTMDIIGISGQRNLVGVAVNAPQRQADGSIRLIDSKGYYTLEPYHAVDRAIEWSIAVGPWQPLNQMKGAYSPQLHNIKWEPLSVRFGTFAQGAESERVWSWHTLETGTLKNASWNKGQFLSGTVVGTGWRHDLVKQGNSLEGHLTVNAIGSKALNKSFTLPTLDRLDKSIGIQGWGQTMRFDDNTFLNQKLYNPEGQLVGNSLRGTLYAATPIRPNDDKTISFFYAFKTNIGGNEYFFHDINNPSSFNPNNPFVHHLDFGPRATSLINTDLRGGLEKLTGNTNKGPGCKDGKCPKASGEQLKLEGGWYLQGNLAFFKESQVDFKKLAVVNEPSWEFNATGLGAHYNNAGSDWDSTPLDPFKGVPAGYTVAHLPFKDDNDKIGSGLFMQLAPGYGLVQYHDWKTGKTYSWSPEKVAGKYNVFAGKMRADGFNAPDINWKDSKYFSFNAPVIKDSIQVNGNRFLSQASGSISLRTGSAANDAYHIFGQDFQSAFSVTPMADGRLMLASDRPYGGLWHISTFGLNGKEITHTIINGLVSTPRIENIPGLNMAQKGALFQQNSFNYQLLKNNPNAINFGNGLGVNLYRVHIYDGSIVGPGVGQNYKNSLGEILPARVIDGFQFRSEKIVKSDELGRTLVTSFNNASLLIETNFIGRSISFSQAKSGSIDQTLTGITKSQLSNWLSKETLPGVNLANFNEKVIEKDGMLHTHLDLNSHDVRLLTSPMGMKILTSPDTVMFSYSHLLDAGKGQSSGIPNLGEGVELKWISPIAYGSNINIHEGTAGMYFARQSDPKTGTANFKADFSPNYSQGMTVAMTPQFKIVSKEVGEDATGRPITIKYADRNYGVRYSKDVWLGHLPDQQGYLRIGAPGSFYGDAALIRDYAYDKPVIFSNTDKSGVVTKGSLTRMDAVMKFQTAGVTAGTIAGKSEDFLAANTKFSNDWNLSYAQGSYTQTFGKTLEKSGQIIDLGVTNANIPTLVAKGDFLIPNLFNKEGNEPSIKITSSVIPVLELKGKVTVNDKFDIHIASGINGFTFEGLDKEGDTLVGLNPNMLALSDIARWTGVGALEKHKDGEIIRNTNNLITRSVTEMNDGRLVKSYLGIDSQAANKEYLSVAEKNAFNLQQTVFPGMKVADPIATKLNGVQKVGTEQLWSISVQDRNSGEFMALPDSRRIYFGEEIGFKVKESIDGSNWVDKDVLYQQGSHYGIKDLSHVPSGLRKDEAGIASGSAKDASKKDAPQKVNLPYDNEINITNQSKTGILSTEGVVPAMLGYENGGLKFNSLAEAGGNTWKLKSAFITGDPKSEKGADVNKTNSIHFSRNDENGRTVDLFIGGDNKNIITFKRDGSIDALGMFEIEGNISPQIAKYENGKWEVTNSKYNFGNGVSTERRQLANGDTRIILENSQVKQVMVVGKNGEIKSHKTEISKNLQDKANANIEERLNSQRKVAEKEFAEKLASLDVKLKQAYEQSDALIKQAHDLYNKIVDDPKYGGREFREELKKAFQAGNDWRVLVWDKVKEENPRAYEAMIYSGTKELLMLKGQQRELSEHYQRVIYAKEEQKIGKIEYGETVNGFINVNFTVESMRWGDSSVRHENAWLDTRSGKFLTETKTISRDIGSSGEFKAETSLFSDGSKMEILLHNGNKVEIVEQGTVAAISKGQYLLVKSANASSGGLEIGSSNFYWVDTATGKKVEAFKSDTVKPETIYVEAGSGRRITTEEALAEGRKGTSSEGQLRNGVVKVEISPVIKNGQLVGATETHWSVNPKRGQEDKLVLQHSFDAQGRLVTVDDVNASVGLSKEIAQNRRAAFESMVGKEPAIDPYTGKPYLDAGIRYNLNDSRVNAALSRHNLNEAIDYVIFADYLRDNMTAVRVSVDRRTGGNADIYRVFDRESGEYKTVSGDGSRIITIDFKKENSSKGINEGDRITLLARNGNILRVDWRDASGNEKSVLAKGAGGFSKMETWQGESLGFWEAMGEYWSSPKYILNGGVNNLQASGRNLNAGLKAAGYYSTAAVLWTSDGVTELFGGKDDVNFTDLHTQGKEYLWAVARGEHDKYGGEWGMKPINDYVFMPVASGAERVFNAVMTPFHAVVSGAAGGCGLWSNPYSQSAWGNTKTSFGTAFREFGGVPYTGFSQETVDRWSRDAGIRPGDGMGTIGVGNSLIRSGHEGEFSRGWNNGWGTFMDYAAIISGHATKAGKVAMEFAVGSYVLRGLSAINISRSGIAIDSAILNMEKGTLSLLDGTSLSLSKSISLSGIGEAAKSVLGIASLSEGSSLTLSGSWGAAKSFFGATPLAIGTTIFANEAAYQQHGKLLSGTEDSMISLSFLLPLAGREIGLSRNIGILNGTATTFWANYGLGIGHTISTYLTGKPMSFAESFSNVVTTYAWIGGFNAAGAALSPLGRSIATWGVPAAGAGIGGFSAYKLSSGNPYITLLGIGGGAAAGRFASPLLRSQAFLNIARYGAMPATTTGLGGYIGYQKNGWTGALVGGGIGLGAGLGAAFAPQLGRGLAWLSGTEVATGALARYVGLPAAGTGLGYLGNVYRTGHWSPDFGDWKTYATIGSGTLAGTSLAFSPQITRGLVSLGAREIPMSGLARYTGIPALCHGAGRAATAAEAYGSRIAAGVSHFSGDLISSKAIAGFFGNSAMKYAGTPGIVGGVIGAPTGYLVGKFYVGDKDNAWKYMLYGAGIGAGFGIVLGTAVGLMESPVPSFIGRQFSETVGLCRPATLLGGSTAGAVQDFTHVKLVVDEKGNARYVSPLSQMGAPGYLAGVLLSPGRTMISTAGDLLGMDWDQKITDIRMNSMSSYLRLINSTDNDGLAFLLASPAYVDGLLNAASGAIQINAISNPAKVAENLASLWNLLNNPETSGMLAKARGGEWGMVVWSVLGYSHGFRYHANLVRAWTNAPESISPTHVQPNGRNYRLANFAEPQVITRGDRTFSLPTLYDSMLTPTQRVGYFFARTDEMASGFVKANTAISLGFSTLNSSEKNKWESVQKSVTGLAYQMPQVASSAYGTTLAFNLVGLGYSRVADSTAVRGFSESTVGKAITGDWGRIALREIPFYSQIGRIASPLIFMEAGTYMYFTGENMQSTTGNYVKLLGLATAGLGSVVLGRNIKQSTLLDYKNSWVNKLVGENAKGWTKTYYNIGYGVAGTAAGIWVGHYRGEINSWKDWDSILAYGLVGAAAGIGARSLPKAMPWAAEVAGESAIVWAINKGIVDPALSATEALLDNKKTFSLREATTFTLTPWEQKHEISRYVDINDAIDRKHLNDDLSKITNLEKILDKEHAMILERHGVNPANLSIDKSTGYLIDKTTGKYLRLPQYQTENRYKIVNGERILDDVSYLNEKTGNLIGKKEISDLPAALTLGILTRAARIGLNTGVKAYREGIPDAAEGWNRGLSKGLREFTTQESRIGIGSIKDWYGFGKANPLIGVGTLGMLGGAGAWALGHYGNKNEWFSSSTAEHLKTAGLTIAGLGALTTAAGLARLATTRAGNIANAIRAAEETPSLAGRISGGTIAATRGIVWDVGLYGTGWNLLIVIAPLQGAVEGTSLFTKEFISPSIYSSMTRGFVDSTLGAFWTTPLEAKRSGDMSLASSKKYTDLIDAWNNPDAKFADKVNTVIDVAGRAYSAGLWGQWDFRQQLLTAADAQGIKDAGNLTTQELIQKLGDKANVVIDTVLNVARLKGYTDIDRKNVAEAIYRLDGRAKVEHLSGDSLSLKSRAEGTYNFIASLGKEGNLSLFTDVDKTNIVFSAILAVASPLAEPIFSNIQYGRFGEKFQAAGMGWNVGLKSLVPASALKGIAKEEESSWASRFFDTVVGGTGEELIPENIIQIGLNTIPFNAIMPNTWAQQFSEIVQEILTPGVDVKTLGVTDLWRSMRNGDRIVTVGFGAARAGNNGDNSYAQRRAETLTHLLQGRDIAGLESGNGLLLRQMAQILQSGDTIIVQSGDRFRTIRVEDAGKFRNYLEMRAKIVEYRSSHTSNERLASIAKSGANKIDQEAANRLLAQRVGSYGRNADAIGGALTRNGEIVIKDAQRRNIATVDARYIAEEALPFNESLRERVLSSVATIPTSDRALRGGFHFVALRGQAHYNRGNALTLTAEDSINLTGTAEQLLPVHTRKMLESYDFYAQYLETGDEFFAHQAGAKDREAQRIQSRIAREGFLREIHFDNKSALKRGLMYANYYTLAKLGIEFGKAKEFKNALKEGIGRSSLVRKELLQLRRQRAEIMKSFSSSRGELARAASPIAPEEKIAQKVRKMELEEIKKQEKKLLKLQKGKIGINHAFNIYHEQTMDRLLRGAGTGGASRTMGLEITSRLRVETERQLENIRTRLSSLPESDFTRSALEKQERHVERALKKLNLAEARLNRALEYDTITVADALTGVVNPYGVFGTRGRETIARLAGNAEIAREALKPLKFKKYGSVINATTKEITSAQNRMDYIAVDLLQNTLITRNKDGEIVVIPNATGEFNVGAGAHEYIHSLIAYAPIHIDVDAIKSGIFGKLQAKRDGGDADLKDKTDDELENIATKQAVKIAKQRMNNKRIQILMANDRLAPLLRMLALRSKKSIGRLNLELSEMGDNEILTQLLSVQEAARFWENTANADLVRLQFAPTDNSITSYLLKMDQKSVGAAGLNLTSAGGLTRKIATMTDDDLIALTYNYVKGGRIYKTDEQRQLDDIARQINEEARRMAGIRFFGNNSYNYAREQVLLNYIEGLVHRLARGKYRSKLEKLGFNPRDVKVVRSLSSVSSGRNTSVVDYTGKLFGRHLGLGDEVTVDLVLQIGNNTSHGVSDMSATYIVEKGRRNNLRLREIRFFNNTNPSTLELLDESDFVRQVVNLGKVRRNAFLAVYQGLKVALEGLKVNEDGERGFSDYSELSRAANHAVSEAKGNMNRFAYYQKIHEMQGSEKLHSFEIGHFQDRSPLKGLINAGDVISLEPFISIPGKLGVRKEIQVQITENGYEILTGKKAPSVITPSHLDSSEIYPLPVFSKDRQVGIMPLSDSSEGFVPVKLAADVVVDVDGKLVEPVKAIAKNKEGEEVAEFDVTYENDTLTVVGLEELLAAAAEKEMEALLAAKHPDSGTEDKAAAAGSSSLNISNTMPFKTDTTIFKGSSSAIAASTPTKVAGPLKIDNKPGVMPINRVDPMALPQAPVSVPVLPLPNANPASSPAPIGFLGALRNWINPMPAVYAAAAGTVNTPLATAKIAGKINAINSDMSFGRSANSPGVNPASVGISPSDNAGQVTGDDNYKSTVHSPQSIVYEGQKTKDKGRNATAGNRNATTGGNGSGNGASSGAKNSGSKRIEPKISRILSSRIRGFIARLRDPRSHLNADALAPPVSAISHQTSAFRQANGEGTLATFLPFTPNARQLQFTQNSPLNRNSIKINSKPLRRVSSTVADDNSGAVYVFNQPHSTSGVDTGSSPVSKDNRKDKSNLSTINALPKFESDFVRVDPGFEKYVALHRIDYHVTILSRWYMIKLYGKELASTWKYLTLTGLLYVENEAIGALDYATLSDTEWSRMANANRQTILREGIKNFWLRQQGLTKAIWLLVTRKSLVAPNSTSEVELANANRFESSSAINENNKVADFRGSDAASTTSQGASAATVYRGQRTEDRGQRVKENNRTSVANASVDTEVEGGLSWFIVKLQSLISSILWLTTRESSLPARGMKATRSIILSSTRKLEESWNRSIATSKRLIVNWQNTSKNALSNLTEYFLPTASRILTSRVEKTRIITNLRTNLHELGKRLIATFVTSRNLRNIRNLKTERISGALESTSAPEHQGTSRERVRGRVLSAEHKKWNIQRIVDLAVVTIVPLLMGADSREASEWLKWLTAYYEQIMIALAGGTMAFLALRKIIAALKVRMNAEYDMTEALNNLARSAERLITPATEREIAQLTAEMMQELEAEDLKSGAARVRALLGLDVSSELLPEETDGGELVTSARKLTQNPVNKLDSVETKIKQIARSLNLNYRELLRDVYYDVLAKSPEIWNRSAITNLINLAALAKHHPELFGSILQNIKYFAHVPGLNTVLQKAILFKKDGINGSHRRNRVLTALYALRELRDARELERQGYFIASLGRINLEGDEADAVVIDSGNGNSYVFETQSGAHFLRNISDAGDRKVQFLAWVKAEIARKLDKRNKLAESGMFESSDNIKLIVSFDSHSDLFTEEQLAEAVVAWLDENEISRENVKIIGMPLFEAEPLVEAVIKTPQRVVDALFNVRREAAREDMVDEMEVASSSIEQGNQNKKVGSRASSAVHNKSDPKTKILQRIEAKKSELANLPRSDIAARAKNIAGRLESAISNIPEQNEEAMAWMKSFSEMLEPLFDQDIERFTKVLLVEGDSLATTISNYYLYVNEGVARFEARLRRTFNQVDGIFYLTDYPIAVVPSEDITKFDREKFEYAFEQVKRWVRQYNPQIFEHVHYIAFAVAKGEVVGLAFHGSKSIDVLVEKDNRMDVSRESRNLGEKIVHESRHRQIDNDAQWNSVRERQDALDFAGEIEWEHPWLGPESHFLGALVDELFAYLAGVNYLLWSFAELEKTLGRNLKKDFGVADDFVVILQFCNEARAAFAVLLQREYAIDTQLEGIITDLQKQWAAVESEVRAWSKKVRILSGLPSSFREILKTQKKRGNSPQRGASSAVPNKLLTTNSELHATGVRGRAVSSPLLNLESREILVSLRSPYRDLARRVRAHMSLMSGIRARKIDKHIVQLTRLENRLLTEFLPEKRTEIEAKIARIKAYLKNYEKQLNQLSQQSDISNDDWA